MRRERGEGWGSRVLLASEPHSPATKVAGVCRVSRRGLRGGTHCVAGCLCRSKCREPSGTFRRSPADFRLPLDPDRDPVIPGRAHGALRLTSRFRDWLYVPQYRKNPTEVCGYTGKRFLSARGTYLNGWKLIGSCGIIARGFLQVSDRGVRGIVRREASLWFSMHAHLSMVSCLPWNRSSTDKM